MTTQQRKLKIGLFTVLSAALAVGGLLWLGASRFFEDSTSVVAYFSESVQGLEADSPVKFRGVPVGRVRAIRMAPDGRLIEVTIRLNRDFKVSDDLGIKMNLVGLTGMKYLEMDTFRSDQKQPPLVLDFQPRYPVILTYPSDIKEFGNALDNIFQKVKTVNVEQISHHLLRVSARLDKITSDGRLDTMGGDAAETMREIREVVRKVNDEIVKTQPSKAVTRTLDKAALFFQESTETARSADRMIHRTDNNLNQLSAKLNRSADNLDEFLRLVRRKPSLLLYGTEEKPGERR